MQNLTYSPIGVVEAPLSEPMRPEIHRAHASRLVLEDRFAPAVAVLETGQYLWVIYHLHRIESWEDDLMPTLFARRIPRRPNPIGITLVQVVACEETTITVSGLDAINGTPILDIKPYRPLLDTPGG
jgi:tRNA-Thr(GGU) m(6)t(6)A37 methyltransferase TsaA